MVSILNINFIGDFIFWYFIIYLFINVFFLFIISLFLSKCIFSLYINTLIVDLGIIILVFICFFFNYDIFISSNFLFFLEFMILNFFLLFFFIVSRNVFLYEKILNYEYIFFIFFSMIVFIFILMTFDFFVFFLCVEIQLLCSYVLASIKRYSVYSIEAGIKYFLFGAFSSSLLIFGFSYLYGMFGTLNIKYICFLIDFYGLDLNLLLFVSFFFIFVGFVFKLGGVPFH